LCIITKKFEIEANNKIGGPFLPQKPPGVGKGNFLKKLGGERRKKMPFEKLIKEFEKTVHVRLYPNGEVVVENYKQKTETYDNYFLQLGNYFLRIKFNGNHWIITYIK